MAQLVPALAAGTAVLLAAKLRKATLDERDLASALDEYRELFNVPVDRLCAIRDALVEQMEAGLAGKPGGLMMLPSYVDVLPSGEEAGHCYAIDLGGTNLRVAHVQLGAERGAVAAAHIREWAVPDEHFDLDRGALLAFVAACTAEVIREHGGGGGGGGRCPVVGFCFSFPVEQTALDNGRVLSMTKNFRGSGLFGKEVVGELRRELAALGVDAAVPAVMNDTVATLVALRYSEPDTQLGIIVGTGTNCAYAERVSGIAKLPAGFQGRSDLMVVNSEWADFSSPALPSCEEDVWIDCSSPHPGRSLFEKQISGLFLGELARRILLGLAEKWRLFGGAGVPGLLARHGAFTTAHMAAADEDGSADLSGVAAVLESALQIRGTSLRQRQVVQEVCRLVCTRSARLCAAGILGMLKRLGHPCGAMSGSGSASGSGSSGGKEGGAAAPPRVVVAFDGSVFAKYAAYRQRLRAALEDVCGSAAAAAIDMQLVQDGSVLGAAFLAVAAAEYEAQHGGGVQAARSSGVDPRRLLGFTAVDLSDGMAEIGTVDDVLAVAETGEAQPLLHVCAPLSSSEEEEEAGGAADGKGRPREEHLLPFVPQIVPGVDLSAGMVYVQPPAGLLDLGRQQQLLAKLEIELAPFSLPPPLGLLARMGMRVMPSASQLEKAGRPDLVAAVRQAGGFLEVAQLLGLRSQRKPAGFWDNEANLDEELTLFVAAHWTKFADPESGQSYWYNQITHRISWEEPVMPARVEIDDEGGYILTEAEEDRVMPSRSAVTAAGRYDLHHAILNHGGYTAAADLLGRPSAWPPSQHLGSLAALRHELRSFLTETGLPRGRMPTAGQLINAGRGDLYQAIVRRGGFAATAQALGWDTQRRARRAWDDADATAAELRRFILGHPPGSGGARLWRGTGGSSSSSSTAASAEHEEEEEAAAGDEPPLPPGTRMPTHRELALAGRHDLKYAIQRHSSAKIAALLGVPLSGRGGHRRPRAAEAAKEVAAGALGSSSAGTVADADS